MTWEVLTGVIEWWADEGLRDVGRRRYHEAKGKVVSENDLAPRGTIHRTRTAFVARRTPWRVAEVSLGPDDDESPAVVAWADEDWAVLKGRPASQHVVGPNETWGDSGLRRMLEPAPLDALVAKPWGVDVQVEGHLLERDMFVLPEFVSLAADRYEATYDGELDVLTSWTAFIDGEVAQRQTLTHLVAVPLDRDQAPRG